MPIPDGRVLVAFTDVALEWDPDWTALDQEHPNLITSYQIDRGRQYELDRTDTGRATVEIADPDGVLDPTNTAGPYYGADTSGFLKIAPLRQIMLRRFNPISSEWETRFRGFIEELDYALDPSQKVWRLTMQCVDIFEILAAINMYPPYKDPPLYVLPGTWAGLLVEGNLDLNDRAVVHNDDGSISTEESITIEEDDMQVLIPTVFNGAHHTNPEAIDHYTATGEHLGKFDTIPHSETYAEALHERQDDYYHDPARTIGGFGDDPTAAGPGFADDVKGQVWYGPVVDGDWRAGQTMEARITRILEQAGIPEDFWVVFSGNVVVQPQSYAPAESPLSAIQETADAEFPGVSNVYTDRHGRMCVHGRLAKFDPAGVLAGAVEGAWDFHEWKAGDGAYITLDPALYAHIREFAFNRGLSKVINHALATPANIKDEDVPRQFVTDDDSIGQYGYRSWSAQSLLTYGGLLGSTSALEETRRFAQYYVDNYKTPLNRVTQITFRSIRPGSPGASETWRLLCQVDVSDTVEVYVDAPEGGGFVGPGYFVEGVHEQSSPLTGVYDSVTLSLDLSPRAYFDVNPWGDT